MDVVDGILLLMYSIRCSNYNRNKTKCDSVIGQNKHCCCCVGWDVATNFTLSLCV